MDMMEMSDSLKMEERKEIGDRGEMDYTVEYRLGWRYLPLFAILEKRKHAADYFYELTAKQSARFSISKICRGLILYLTPPNPT